MEQNFPEDQSEVAGLRTCINVAVMQAPIPLDPPFPGNAGR